MKNRNVESVLKSKKKEMIIYSVAFLAAAMLPLYLSHILWVRILPFFPALFVYMIVMRRTTALKYLIEDECNPELYYYAYMGLNKKEPELEQKQLVAELIGDFKAATEIAYSRLNLCKKESQRLLIILDIARISFDAGDFDLTKKAYDEFNNLKIKAKLKSNHEELLKFYMCFIEEDYENAKNHFDEGCKKYKSKKVKNIHKYKMCYYDGLLKSALGEGEQAEASFNKVICCCPSLYIAKMSNNMLSDNAFVNSISLADAAQKGASNIPEKKKTDYMKIISFLLAIIAIIWSLIAIAYSENVLDNMENPEIEATISYNYEAEPFD